MSYPYDLPSLSMSTIWNSGSYKPTDVVRTIRDNFTPINKNSMVNSVGQEISLVQNYVNSKYLGREELPIISGFIKELWNDSGHICVWQSGYYAGYSTYHVIDSGVLSSINLRMSHNAQDPIDTFVNYGYSGIYGFASNGISQSQSHEWWLYPSHFHLYNSGPTSINDKYDVSIGQFDLIPQSGLSFIHTNNTTTNITKLDVGPTGIMWSWDDGATPNNININAYPNAQFLAVSGDLVIGTGPHSLNSTLQSPGIGNLSISGDAFIQTHGGNGILLTGDNGIYDRIISYASEYFNIACGSTSIKIHNSGVMGLPVDASSAQTSYNLVNAIKACLIERGWATAI